MSAHWYVDVWDPSPSMAYGVELLRSAVYDPLAPATSGVVGPGGRHTAAPGAHCNSLVTLQKIARMLSSL